MNDTFGDFVTALRADVVVKTDHEGAGALSISDALGLRDWFDQERRNLISKGGRPSNPAWTIKRQIPMRDSTWDALKSAASGLSEPGEAISPAQLAALLLERSLKGGPTYRAAPSTAPAEDATAELPDELHDWTMPSVFGMSRTAA